MNEIVEEHYGEAEGNSSVKIELVGYFDNGQRKVDVAITALTRKDALMLAEVCRDVATSLEEQAG